MPCGVSPWVCLVWESLGFLDLGGYFPAHFREVFNYYLKYFLMPFLFLFFSGTPMIRMLGCLTLSRRSLRLSSFLLIHFSSLIHLFLPFYLLPNSSYLCLHYSINCSLQSVFYIIIFKFFNFKVLYNSVNFPFYNLLLPCQNPPIFKANLMCIFFVILVVYFVLYF